MRTRLLLVLFSLLLLMTLSSVSLGQQTTASPSSENEHLPLPESVLNAQIKSARGRPFRLSDYSGKVLVINLWATWLVPSRLEIPSLVKLQRDLWSQGVRVVGLSTESPTESARVVREFVRDFRIQYKIGWAPPDLATTLMYVGQGRDVVPQTFVISRSGKITKRFIGFNSQVTPSQLREAVEEALNGSRSEVSTTMR